MEVVVPKALEILILARQILSVFFSSKKINYFLGLIQSGTGCTYIKWSDFQMIFKELQVWALGMSPVGGFYFIYIIYCIYVTYIIKVANFFHFASINIAFVFLSVSNYTRIGSVNVGVLSHVLVNSFL